MEVARAHLTTVPGKNDDQYIWISMQVVVFFEIIAYENQTFCLMLFAPNSSLGEKIKSAYMPSWALLGMTAVR